MGIIFLSVPVGSLQRKSILEREKYIMEIFQLPSALQDLVFSPQTGAFLRGLAKTYNLPESSVPAIAFMILRICTGELALPGLGSTLSTEVRVANDKAQTIATEIEKELFAPVMLDLSRVLEVRHQKLETSKATREPYQAGARNVVDLRSMQKPVSHPVQPSSSPNIQAPQPFPTPPPIQRQPPTNSN